MILFFMMIRLPPRSTLFPTRRSSDLVFARLLNARPGPGFSWKRTTLPRVSSSTTPRSEEHTSELQSRRDLVCRLLLEKKKTLMLALTELYMTYAQVRRERTFRTEFQH